jgi:hypothetical protein
LKARVDVAQAQSSLEKEIVAEMAAALGRAEDKLNVALLRLELAGKDLASAAPDERPARAVVFDGRRADALRARWELVIQRESVGILRNEVIERMYPIPPRARGLSTRRRAPMRSGRVTGVLASGRLDARQRHLRLRQAHDEREDDREHGHRELDRRSCGDRRRGPQTT